MKRIFKKAVLLLVSCVLCVMPLFVFGGCYKPDTGYEKVNPGTLPEPDPNKDYAKLGLEKYETPVKLTVAAIEYPLEADVKVGTSPRNQAFNRIAKDVLNIELEYTVVASSGYYDTQLNLAVSADRTPDMFYTTNGTLYAGLKKNGKLADLGEVFHYLNDDLKQIYREVAPELLTNVMDNGKLYAFPMASNKYETAPRLYVRKDWLEKVKKSAPTTIDELIDVGQAFLDNRNLLAGEDTIPLVANKEIIWAGSTSLMGLFQSHGTSPGAYFLGDDGKLYAGNTAPEMKDALSTLHTLYEREILDNDFVSKNVDMVYGNIASGQAGMVLGEWWLPNGKIGESVVNVAGADWIGVDLPAFGDKQALPVVKRVNLTGYNLVSSKCEHPEAAAKLINLFYDIYYNDDAEQKYGKDVRPEEGFFYNFVPIKLWNAVSSVEEHKRVQKVFEDAYAADMKADWTVLSEAEENALSADQKTKYQAQKAIYDRLRTREKTLHFKSGYPYYCALRAGKSINQMSATEKGGWAIYHTMIAPDGGYAYVTDLTEGRKSVRYDEFYGTPTTVMVEKGETLNTFAQTSYTQMIRGEKPISYFDDFVAEYNRAGGSDLIKQLNDWYQAQWHEE